MIGNKRVLGIIPARGGSKGIPRKNLRVIDGKPLLAWTIDEARKSIHIDRLILSSEDQEIISCAQNLGCDVPFVRPSELSRDETPGIDPVLHALLTLEEKFYYVVLLQVTSPLRSFEDIDACIETCHRLKAPACVSVTKPDKSPYWMYLPGKDNRLEPLISTHISARRQDLPNVLALNGAVYVAQCDWLLQEKSFVHAQTRFYQMPKDRSLDIDEEADLALFEWYLSRK